MNAILLAWLRRRAKRRYSPWLLGGLASAGFLLAIAISGGMTLESLQSQCQPGGGSAQFVSLGGPAPGGLTVKGAPASPSQIQAGKVILGVAATLHAGGVAATAMVFAAIWESGMTQNDPPNYLGYGGILAGADAAFHGDSVAQAKGFLLGGAGYESGGAMNLSRSISNPIEVAVRVEVPSIWPSNAYASEAGYPGDAAATKEASAWTTGLGGLPVSAAGQQQCVLASFAGPGQYVNPFRSSMAGLVSQRIDMGVDYDNTPGAPILAIGRARIDAAGTGIGGGWTCSTGVSGGVYYQLLDGPDAGRHVYVTEDVVPTVSGGTIVPAGATVARFDPGGSSPCIEIGWGSGTPWGTEAAALGQQASGDPGGNQSFCGQLMSQLIASLGGKPGLADQPKSGSSCPVM